MYYLKLDNVQILNLKVFQKDKFYPIQIKMEEIL